MSGHPGNRGSTAPRAAGGRRRNAVKTGTLERCPSRGSHDVAAPSADGESSPAGFSWSPLSAIVPALTAPRGSHQPPSTIHRSGGHGLQRDQRASDRPCRVTDRRTSARRGRRTCACGARTFESSCGFGCGPRIPMTRPEMRCTDLIDAALRLLGVRRFALAIHDSSFPSTPEEDIGRGSPYSEGGLDFLRFARSLGFNVVQLGPQGKTTRGDPSPYDGCIFSKSILSLAALTLAGRRPSAGTGLRQRPRQAAVCVRRTDCGRLAADRRRLHAGLGRVTRAARNRARPVPWAPRHDVGGCRCLCPVSRRPRSRPGSTGSSETASTRRCRGRRESTTGVSGARQDGRADSARPEIVLSRTR